MSSSTEDIPPKRGAYPYCLNGPSALLVQGFLRFRVPLGAIRRPSIIGKRCESTNTVADARGPGDGPACMDPFREGEWVGADGMAVLLIQPYLLCAFAGSGSYEQGWQPPATARTIETVSSSLTGVSRSPRNRMSSSLR